MDMAGAGEASRGAAQRAGNTTRVSFLAASEQWERNKNGQRLRNETSEPESAPGDWRSRMEQTVRQQAREVTQLPQTINRMARLLEAHAAREEAQWRGMKEWLEDRETKWDDRHRDNVLRGAGISDMTAKVMASARAGDAAPTQKARKEERDETARQDGEGQGATQHDGAVQGGKPEKRQLQQQPKPKPRLLLKQESKQ